MPRTDVVDHDEAAAELQLENYRRQWDIFTQRMMEAADAQRIRAMLHVHRYEADRKRQRAP